MALSFSILRPFPMIRSALSGVVSNDCWNWLEQYGDNAKQSGVCKWLPLSIKSTRLLAGTPLSM